MFTDLTRTHRPSAAEFDPERRTRRRSSSSSFIAAAPHNLSNAADVRKALRNDEELMAYVRRVLGEKERPRKAKTFRQPATAEAIRDLCAAHIVSLEEMFETAHLTRTPHCLWEEEVAPSWYQRRVSCPSSALCLGGRSSGRRGRSASLGARRPSRSFFTNSANSLEKDEFEALTSGEAERANISGGGRLLSNEKQKQKPFACGGAGVVTGRPRTVREVLKHDHRCRSATALFELAHTCHAMAAELSTRHRKEVADLKCELASVKRCVSEWEACFGNDPTVTPATVGAELRSLRFQVADLQRVNEELRARHSAFRVQHDSLVRYYDPNNSTISTRNYTTNASTPNAAHEKSTINSNRGGASGRLNHHHHPSSQYGNQTNQTLSRPAIYRAASAPRR